VSVDHTDESSNTVQVTRKTAPTIYDIARLAEVSPSTVSRALNKPGRLNQGTERRIRAAADELGYRLNPIARALHTGKTQTIGLVLSDITNPVYFDLVRGAERAVASEQYTLVLAESQESAELERETVSRIGRSVDGLILVASRLGDQDIIELSSDKPLVLVNREVPGVASLVPDVAQGIREALDHLKSLGHRSIAFLRGPTASWMSSHRWEVLFDEAVSRGLHVIEIGPNSPTLEGGADSLRRVRASGVTAVIAFNDLMALGLLMASQQDGFAVPEEISIIGFDDIFGTAFTTPAVTSVRSPLGDLGEDAARELLAVIDQTERTAHRPLHTTLIERQSTGIPRTG
jgi:LacI family transcriptional regulator